MPDVPLAALQSVASDAPRGRSGAAETPGKDEGGFGREYRGLDVPPGDDAVEPEAQAMAVEGGSVRPLPDAARQGGGMTSAGPVPQMPGAVAPPPSDDADGSEPMPSDGPETVPATSGDPFLPPPKPAVAPAQGAGARGAVPGSDGAGSSERAPSLPGTAAPAAGEAHARATPGQPGTAVSATLAATRPGTIAPSGPPAADDAAVAGLGETALSRAGGPADAPFGLTETAPADRAQSTQAARPDAPRAVPMPHQQIVEAVRRSTDRSIELRLWPEELGHVRMSLSGAEGVLSVQITVERQETLDLIRRHIDSLVRDLRQEGFGDLDLSLGRQGSDGDGASRRDDDGMQVAARRPDGIPDAVRTAPRPPPGLRAGRLDITL